jgi:hypothetical protein
VAQGGLETPDKGGSETLEKHNHDDGGTPARNVRGRRWQIRQCAFTFARLTQLRGGGGRGVYGGVVGGVW